jgi:hypothetical protein
MRLMVSGNAPGFDSDARLQAVGNASNCVMGDRFSPVS